jgi:hypothetical protein
MLHTALIVLHAGAGVACFAAGVLLHPAAGTGSWRLRVYAGSLMAMLGASTMSRVKARLSAQQPVDSTGTMGSG